MAPHTIETLRLLLVSSDVSVLRLLSSAAHFNSWHLETSSSGWDAMERVQSESAPHLLLLDIPPADGDSIHLLPWLRRLRPELPIAVVCDSQDLERQKEATRMGAKDILVRPVTEEQIESVVRRNLGSPNDSVEPEIASEDIESVGEDEFFLSISPVMQQLRAQTQLLAQADVPVLILGEPGSGKATIARLIHQMSVYSGFNFLRVNCEEMPGDLLEIELFGRENRSEGSSKGLGKLESGQKGTLLLDEITQMPLAVQSRLLKVLQDRRSVRTGNSKIDVDVRILASSSDQLDRALAEKRLDNELYYRLSAFTVHVPPLRQRKEEIKFLLRYTMHKLAKHYGLPAREFTQPALDACQNHLWPGNLMELENFVKRYLVAGDENLSLEGWKSSPKVNGHRVRTEIEFREGASSTSTLKSMIQNVRWETERNAIAAALQKTGWNRKAAARLLGVSYRTILYKIDQYEMVAPESYLSSFQDGRLGVPTAAKGNGKAS
ncbi:MAG TPA: sigma-54 dependent transcriptional regulator [Candidatus Sulfotelmatobacter sp.]|nr:sigma-54 dependent transcriptional regulator [Candidatus Sulfotelmatobacter sp.]